MPARVTWTHRPHALVVQSALQLRRGTGRLHAAIACTARGRMPEHRPGPLRRPRRPASPPPQRRQPDSNWTVRSLPSAYSRLWNADVVDGLVPALDWGWRVPPARPAVDDPRARPATVEDILLGQESFGLSVKVGDMLAPAGVYAGDRDMFIFLVNPNRVIDDGMKGLMRGVFVWNSEVGAGAFKVRTFYLENVCGNHIVWSASGVPGTPHRPQRQQLP
ncbi:MAG: hypothetical protein WKG07_29515 [Hymenobacter sp.]